MIQLQSNFAKGQDIDTHLNKNFIAFSLKNKDTTTPKLYAVELRLI